MQEQFVGYLQHNEDNDETEEFIYPEGSIATVFVLKRHPHCPPDLMSKMKPYFNRTLEFEDSHTCTICSQIDMMPVHWCPLDRPVKTLFSVLKLPLNYVTLNSMQRSKPYCKCLYRYSWMHKVTENLKVNADSGYFIKYKQLLYRLKTYYEFRIEVEGLGEILFNLFIDAVGNVFSSVEACQSLEEMSLKCNVTIRNMETEDSTGFDGHVICLKEKRPLDFQFRFGKALFTSCFESIDESKVKDDSFIMCGLIVTSL